MDLLSWMFVLFFIVPLTSVVTVVVLESSPVQALLGARANILFLRSSTFEDFLLSRCPINVNMPISQVRSSGALWSWLGTQILSLGGDSQRPNNPSIYDLFKYALLVAFDKTEFLSVGSVNGWVVIFLGPFVLFFFYTAWEALQHYVVLAHNTPNIARPLGTLPPQNENRNEHENFIPPIHDNRHVDPVCVRCIMKPIISVGPPINTTLSTNLQWRPPHNPSNMFELMAALLHKGSQNIYSERSDLFGFNEQNSINEIESEGLVGKDDLQTEGPLETWTRWMVTVLEPNLYISPLQSTAPVTEFHIPPLQFTSPLTLYAPSMSITASLVTGEEP